MSNRALNRWAAFFAAVYVGAFAFLALEAWGQSIPSEPNYIHARFPTTSPAAVAVQVVDEAGVALGTPVAAAKIPNQETGDVWQINAATLTGYPVACQPRKSFVATWNPDSSDCAGVDRAGCITSTFTVGGSACSTGTGSGGSRVNVATTYARTVVTGQGITQSVLNAYRRIGQDPERWDRVDEMDPADDQSVLDTFWRVHVYSSEGAYEHRKCTVVSYTDPALAGNPTYTCAEGN